MTFGPVNGKSFERNELHQLVDPSGLLPNVQAYDFASNAELVSAIKNGGELEGETEGFFMTADVEGVHQVVSYGRPFLVDSLDCFVFGDVKAFVQKAGFGMQTYLFAITRALELGKEFRANRLYFSESAKGVWEKLIAAGIADQYSNFTIHPRFKPNWSADIRVISHRPSSRDQG